MYFYSSEYVSICTFIPVAPGKQISKLITQRSSIGLVSKGTSLWPWGLSLDSRVRAVVSGMSHESTATKELGGRVAARCSAIPDCLGMTAITEP